MKRLDASRREFLRRTAALSTLGSAAPFAMNLATMSAAVAQTAPTDYKALVCVFMFGGNDQGNTVLATDPTSWAEYIRLRGAIALPAVGATNGVLPIVPNTVQSGRDFALHPNMGDLKGLFDAGRAAVIANVGPLVAPMTKAQYTARSVPLPRSLFSHNDQASTWMAFAPEGARYGWGGKMGDLLASMNTTSTFTSMSLGGNQVWLSGQTTIQYQLGGNGGISIGGTTGTLFGSTAAPAIFRQIIGADRPQLFEKEQARITQRALDAQQLLQTSMLPANTLEAVPNLPGTNTQNSLAAQMQTVARVVGARTALGAKRQMFFVSIGGFDTHDNQLNGQGGQLLRVSQALAYLDRLMASGPVNAANQVTAFTASDFGRTLNINGDGTDHGWGGHHFVTGGAVKGKDVYGRYPVIGVNGPDDVGSGRLLPVNSVDQMAATLAKWFGLTDPQINDIIPNIGNYGTARDMGFMLPA